MKCVMLVYNIFPRHFSHFLKFVIFTVVSFIFLICYYFKHHVDFTHVIKLNGDWRSTNISRCDSTYRYETKICNQDKCISEAGKSLYADDCNFFWHPKDYIELNSTSVSEFVFVTAASENHTKASIYCIDTVHKYFSDRKIIFYDLGITSTERIAQIKSVKNVEYRKMDFSRYPKHVATINQYFWKPLIILEALESHPAVFWIDSTVRFMPEAQHLSHLFNYILTETAGALLFQSNPTSHSNYAVTHPLMYEYLPTDTERQKQTKQFGSGTMLFYRTKRIMENIMYWFVLCALDRDCLAPRGADVDCKSENKVHEYWNCHRYDQAAINILLSNTLHFNHTKYVYPEKVLRITWVDIP